MISRERGKGDSNELEGGHFVVCASSAQGTKDSSDVEEEKVQPPSDCGNKPKSGCIVTKSADLLGFRDLLSSAQGPNDHARRWVQGVDYNIGLCPVCPRGGWRSLGIVFIRGECVRGREGGGADIW